MIKKIELLKKIEKADGDDLNSYEICSGMLGKFYVFFCKNEKKRGLKKAKMQQWTYLRFFLEGGNEKDIFQILQIKDNPNLFVIAKVRCQYLIIDNGPILGKWRKKKYSHIKKNSNFGQKLEKKMAQKTL